MLVIIACGAPPDAKPAIVDTISDAAPRDSLVLTSPGGAEVWFTLARSVVDTGGNRCVERGLEIRHSGKRIPVPLLYTGAAPVLLNDSTVRAELWTHCQPGDAYRINLKTGQPVPERS